MKFLRNWLRSWLGFDEKPAPVETGPAPMSVSPMTLAAFTAVSSNQTLARLGSRVVIPREIKPYEPPPGVVPKADQRARDQAAHPNHEPYMAMDDAGAFQPGFGWLNQQHCGLGFPGYAYLSELSQRSEYRAPSETISTEMTRKFIKFVSRGKGKGKDDKADKLAQLEQAFKKYDIRQLCRKVLELDMFFGRAQLYIKIKDQDTPDQKALPLVIDPKTIAKGSLLGFKIIEPIWTTPYRWNSIDPTSDDFYRPDMWYVLGQMIHHTRLITVISRPVPDLLKPSYNFGGISLTQLMEPYVLRWLKTVDGVNRIINNFSVLMLKTNMQAVLQSGQNNDPTAGQSLLDRARLFVGTRDNQGLMMLDKDTEEMDQIAVPLAGLHELQAQAQEHMAAPSHVPLVKLTGITPSGLNASSEGEITVFHEFIEGEDENVLEPVLDIIIDVVQLSEFGSIDEDIDYEFVPLVEATLKEIADIRKSDAELGGSLIADGVIDPAEERTRLILDPNSGYNHLEGPPPEPPADAEFERGEEGAENAHERSEEGAENAHERALEAQKAKPQPGAKKD